MPHHSTSHVALTPASTALGGAATGRHCISGRPLLHLLNGEEATAQPSGNPLTDHLIKHESTDC